MYTTRRGKPEQDRYNRTGRTGQISRPGQVKRETQNRKDRTVHTYRTYIQNGTGRT
jgi:hypothetical protein